MNFRILNHFTSVRFTVKQITDTNTSVQQANASIDTLIEEIGEDRNNLKKLNDDLENLTKGT